MERFRNLVVVTLVFTLGCAVGGVASRFAVPPVHGRDIQRWDYFCMSKSKLAGPDGWEMVTADSLQASQSICFKCSL
jgi:hypothetical protein